VEWNRGPGYDPHSYAHLIYKGTKNMMEKKTASSTNVAGKSGYLPTEDWKKIHACRPVLVQGQNRHKQGLPH
jgi:hypothetical protein